MLKLGRTGFFAGFILALLLPVAEVNAASDVSFRPVLKDITAGDIQMISQDSEGYIWVGGRHALLRYNAYEFQDMQIAAGENANPEPMSIASATGLVEDDSGSVWISSKDGIYLLDKNRDVLIKAKLLDGALAPEYSEPSWAIAKLKNGDILFGTNDGITVVDRATRQPEKMTFSNFIQGFEHNEVYSILVVDEATVWIGARTGLFRFNPINKHVEHFLLSPENPHSQVDNSVSSLALNPDGRVWCGTTGSGLFIFDPKAEVFEQRLLNREATNSMPISIIWDILLDSKGYVWLAHGREGFTRYDPSSGSFETHSYVIGQPGSPAYEATLAIFQDSNDDIWIGHYPGGVSFHDSSEAIRLYRKGPSVDTSLGHNNVLGVMEAADGIVWATVGNGVDRMDLKTGVIKHYNKNLGNYPALGTLSGYIDRLGQIWVGTWTEGYSRFDEEQDKFISQPVNPKVASEVTEPGVELHDATVWSFCESDDGAFWVGTHNAGISRRDPQTGLLTKFTVTAADNRSLSNRLVWACLEDSKGRFWVGTSAGLNLIDLTTNTIKKYVPEKGADNQLQTGSVTTVVEDQAGRIWLGTDSGLYLYNEVSDDFRHFGRPEGLLNLGIKAITLDLHGDLWLGTNSGIARFNPNTYEVRHFLELAGVKLSGINFGAAVTRQDGTVLFGSVDGLVAVEVDKLNAGSKPAPIVFTDLKIFAKSVAVDVNNPDATLNRVIDRTESITLDHTENMVAVEFAALSYRNPDDNVYAYKLEGFDHAWREIGNERRAQYTNLEAGAYLLKVKSSSGNGIWNDEKSILIRQLPPPWETWWAYTLYTLAVLSLLTYLFYLQKRKRKFVEEQNHRLELKVAERTADLANKNKDIQSMLSSMRQGLFTIEESGNIHQEYSLYLESIFERAQLQGVRATDLLFKQSKLGADVQQQVEASIHSIIGMDVMNFELNSHLLVREYEVVIKNHSKVLALDWSPIVEQDEVKKLMVSVKDITELTVLQLQAEHQRRELKIIGELLKLELNSCLQFFDTTDTYLGYCETATKGRFHGSGGGREKLFAALHTIKGNSRTRGFSLIAEAAHTAESVLAASDVDQRTADIPALTQACANVKKVVDEYREVNSTILNRNASTGAAKGGGVWVDLASLETLKSAVTEVAVPQAGKTITRMIDALAAARLSTVLGGTLIALENAAKELCKPSPQINIDENGCLIKARYHSLFRDVFSHLLHNSLDHGLESPEERSRLGKSRSGTISIKVEPVGDEMCILLQDDGRGLDIYKIYSRAIANAKISQDQVVTNADIAAFILDSGFTTKTEVTDISGRGVGLNAVKQIIEKYHGVIKVHCRHPNRVYRADSELCFEKFKIAVYLPANMFLSPVPDEGEVIDTKLAKP